jgi:hypothetical protein
VQLQVSLQRMKGRRVGTRALDEGETVREALDRLRAWALTRGVAIESDLSWSPRGPGDEDIVVSCELPEGVEVHPDDGILVEHLPSRYEAAVEVPSSDVEPRDVGRQLETWALDSAYAVTGPFEVFVHRLGETGYRLSLPVQRKPKRDHIEV